MALGISIYPAKATEQELMDYLDLAHKYKYEWIFTSLLALKEQSQDSDKLKRIIAYAKNLGFKIQVDVSPEVFDFLDIEPTDLSYFKELGVSAIRLDEPFNGQVESIMTLNPYGIKIIVNASMNNHYIDLIKDYRGDMSQVIACHNFYPQPYTGLSREYFLKTTEKYCKLGLQTAAFINGTTGTLCSRFVADGCVTLEEHRTKDVVAQVRDLKYTGLIDDIYFSTMFISAEELKQVADTYYGENVVTLDVDLCTKINSVERDIIEDLHIYRGDISEYMIRSTMMRIKYKDQPMPENNAMECLKYGDIVILNDNFANYAKELHIVLKDFAPNNQKYNVVGKIDKDQLVLIDTIKPWAKFKLAIKNNEKIR